MDFQIFAARRLAAPVLLRLLVAAWLAMPAEASAQVTVEGRVALPDKSSSTHVARRYYRVAPGVEAEAPDPAKAAVYLKPAGAAVPAGNGAAAATIAVSQKGLQFRPGLVVVRVGTTVEFPNLDDTYHSVFSYSKPKRFDLGRYRQDEEPASLTFDEPGVVKLFCEIHEHMRGTIVVVDTPYFTTTDVEGSFRIDGVPPGRYRATAWLDDDEVVEREVEVAADPTRIDFPVP